MGQAAVKRYWPGRAPDWYNEKQAEAESEEDASEEDEADVTAIATPVVIKASDDPRLRRLAQVPPCFPASLSALVILSNRTSPLA